MNNIPNQATIDALKRDVERLAQSTSQAIQMSTSIKRLINEAKTSYKREYYTKKLVKNNKDVADAMITVNAYKNIIKRYEIQLSKVLDVGGAAEIKSKNEETA